MFGGLFLLSGVISLFTDPITGALIILVALFLLPPVREFVYSKTNKEISVGYRALIIIVLIAIVGATAPEPTVEEKEERRLNKEKIETEKTRKYFKEHKVEILTEVEIKILDGNYKEAIFISSKYLLSEDQELTKMNKKAKDFLVKKQREQRAQMVAKVKKEREKKKQDKLIKSKNPSVVKELLEEHKTYICSFVTEKLGGGRTTMMDSPIKSTAVRKGNKLYIKNENVLTKIGENKYSSGTNVVVLNKVKSHIMIAIHYNNNGDVYSGTCK